MERKIGEIFTYNGKTYQVIKSTACIDCAFQEKTCSGLKPYIGPCTNMRSDSTSVIFKEIENMERKVGEIFTYDNKTYKVVPGYGCENCGFKALRCNMRVFSEVRGACDSSMRKDGTNVIFKEVKKYMEIKNNQLTIDIPEGMEIDLKNSDLSNGIVKFKKKGITYENVEDALKLGKNCKSIIINESNASKLVALSKLMNIARYYNKDWKPDWDDRDKHKYYIIYNNIGDTYSIDYNYSYIYNNVYFKNKEDALEVIHNLNFKDILDTIYKN